jgi:hypothetical protein
MRENRIIRHLYNAFTLLGSQQGEGHDEATDDEENVNPKRGEVRER